jgi:hypothetical protein
MKKRYVFLLILLLNSCGPMDKKFSRKEYKDDLKEIKNTGIPERDIILLEYYLSKADSTKIAKGTTYKELLEMARNEKMKREIGKFIKEDSTKTIIGLQKQKNELVNNIITVSLVSIDLIKTDSADWEFKSSLNIFNKGNKDINAFKGIITFRDIFGETIRKEEFKYDMILKAGVIKSYNYILNYNKKNAADQMLAESEEEKIVFQFEPSKIIFIDGTEMNL